MIPFDYLRPTTVAEALEMLMQYGPAAKALAGGTDLLVEWRKGGEHWQGFRYAVDIFDLTELKGIREEEEEIVIGPVTSHAAVQDSPLIQQYAPLLAVAASTVGSPQIRHRGTIGGNIANASPAADTVPALVALNAMVTLTAKGGSRVVPIADLFVKPYKTQIAPEELITEVRFKKLSFAHRSAFIKLGRRNALAISRMNVAVILRQNADGTVDDVRIVPGSTMPTPVRVAEAEQVLCGRIPDEDVIVAAGAAVSQIMIARTGIRWSTEYKEPVIAALTRRAIRQALGVKER